MDSIGHDWKKKILDLRDSGGLTPGTHKKPVKETRSLINALLSAENKKMKNTKNKSNTYLFNLVVRRFPLDSDCGCAGFSRLFSLGMFSFVLQQVGYDSSLSAPSTSELCTV